MFTRIRTDQGIIRSILRGNTAAFSILIDRYGQMVYGVAYARVGNPADAEEVVQEVFVRLYQWLDRIVGRSSVGPWLAEVARNAATDLLRTKRRTVPLDDDVPQPEATSPSKLEREELGRLVREQMAAMDEADREILVLHYFQQLKIKDIARLLDISPQAAAKRLQRARDELGRQIIAYAREYAPDLAAPKRRARTIMSAIAAAPVAWQPSASLAIAGTALAGVSTAKAILAAAAVCLIVAAGGFFGWRWWFRPYATQDITAQSSFASEKQSQPPLPIPPSSTADPTDGKDKASTPNDNQPSATPAIALPGMRVSGMVVFENGKSAPGALVRITNKLTVMRAEDLKKPPVAPFERSQHADAQGCFFFDRIPDMELSFAALDLAAETADLVASGKVYKAGGIRDRYIELVLRPNASVKGHVFDEAGAGVDAASIFAQVRSSQVSTNAKSEKDGSFLIPYLPPGPCLFIITAAGFTSPKQTEWLHPGSQELSFNLQRGLNISGHLTNAADGTPLSGVRMAARIGDTSDGARTFTAPDGQFKIDGLLPSIYGMKLEPEKASTPYVLTEPVTIDLTQGRPQTGVELKATLGATVSGRVVDEKNNTPLPDVSIGFKREDPKGFYLWSATDDIGHYSAAPLMAGHYTVVLNSDQIHMETKFTLPSLASIEGVDFKMRAHVPIGGTVVDAQGNPVAGATVIAVPAKLWPINAVSDPTGHFSFLIAQETGPTYLQAYGNGCVSRRAGPFKDGDHALRLLPAARIEGNVVDKSGAPVQNATVQANPAESDMITMSTPDGNSWSPRENADGTRAQTGYSGFFQIEPVLPGQYTLEVYIAGVTAGPPAAKANAYLETGQTLRTRLVVDTGSFGSINGAVTRGDGPAIGVSIKLESKSGGVTSHMATTTTPEGYYNFASVVPGAVTVTLVTGDSIGGSSEQNQQCQLDAGESKTIDFNIEQTACAIEGAVTLNGQPLLATVIMVPAGSSGESGKVEIYTDGLGYFKAENLHEAEYDIRARDMFEMQIDNNSPPQATVKTESGKTIRCDINLEGGGIEGTVAGVREDERAGVGIFPGTIDLGAIMSLPSVLQEQLHTSAIVGPDHTFKLVNISPGIYYLGAIAVPATEGLTEAAMMQSLAKGRYTLVKVEIAAGKSTIADIGLQ